MKKRHQVLALSSLWVMMVALSACAPQTESKTTNAPHAVDTHMQSAQFTQAPLIAQNPNPLAPLAAVMTLNANGASAVHLRAESPSHSVDIAIDDLANRDLAQLPVLGLRADQTYQITVAVHDADGNETTWPEALTYTTPPLPVDRYDWPGFEITKAETDRMEPGYTLMSVRRHLLERPQLRTPAQTKFMVGWGMLMIVDSEGEVVWYFLSDRRIAGVEHLNNGNILYQLSDSRTVEIDMLGNTVRQFYAENRPEGPIDDPQAIPIIGLQTLHHQPHKNGRGNFLSLSANAKTIENWYTNEYDPTPRATQRVMGDTIIEFTPKGEVVWSWDAWDYLDPFQIGYETFDPYWVTRGFPDTWDWTHGNGVSYDPRDSSVIVSFKLLDAIIKIDRATKEIKWIFGDPIGWDDRFKDKLLTPVGEGFRWPYHQHNPRWTKAGTLLVFNNNRGQTKPFDGREQVPYSRTYSYSVEYEIDEVDKTVRQVWVSEPEQTPDSCVSFAMSEAHRLPQTDNILEFNAQCGPSGVEDVTWDPWILDQLHISEMPRGARVREYTRTQPAEVVFEAKFDDKAGLINWEVYGGFRMPDLYSGAPEGP